MRPSSACARRTCRCPSRAPCKKRSWCLRRISRPRAARLSRPERGNRGQIADLPSEVPRMQALVKTGPAAEDLELQDLPEPSPAVDEVKLKVAAAGICGTDIHIIKGEWPCRPPVVLGHEFCGTVVETGAAV